MNQEIEIVGHKVVGGRRIKSVSYPTRHSQYHQAVLTLSSLAYGMVRSQSNNTKVQSIARETRKFWKQWDVFKVEWSLAKKYRDAPLSDYETERYVAFPSDNEILLVPNRKVQRAVAQIIKLAELILGRDSAKTENWSGPVDIEEIEEGIAMCEDICKTYLGSGEGDAEGGFDSGLNIPYFSGEYIPDLDGDTSAMFEPSTEAPGGIVPDAPDQDSLAPNPGSPAPAPVK